jgi:phosphoglycerol transferase MdoB-like AlkP superfamily enzyme
MDHGFDVVKDENDFPSNLERGKLNFYDRDLYNKFLEEINQTKEPFMQCAFTGSTHSPFDIPENSPRKWEGNEADFMKSIIYADKCLGEFVRKAKKQKWYKNTLFVFVADHSHTTPNVASPLEHKYYRIPLLFWGPALKKSYQGYKNEAIASQFDIPATLLYQMGIESKEYIWSRDMMNPKMIPFAFHTIIRGYGWVSPKGHLTFQMQMQQYLENSYSEKDKSFEQQRCKAFITEIYKYYKEL